MSYTAQAAQYREMEILSASPAQLVVVLYDHLLVNLRRARIAMGAGNVELRIELLSKARLILGELLATLDHEKGGKIAADLSGLYAFLFSELMDLGRTQDLERLDRLTSIVGDLRDAFAQIASEQPAVA
jgi:flagellar protein FliS